MEFLGGINPGTSTKPSTFPRDPRAPSSLSIPVFWVNWDGAQSSFPASKLTFVLLDLESFKNVFYKLKFLEGKKKGKKEIPKALKRLFLGTRFDFGI